MPATNVDPFLFEEVAQHPAARERELKMQLVHSAHDGQIGCGHRSGPAADAAAADTKSPGLVGDCQISGAVDQRCALSRPDVARARRIKNRWSASARRSWH